MRHLIAIASLALAGCGTNVTFEFRSEDTRHPIVGAAVKNNPRTYLDFLRPHKIRRGTTDVSGRWTARLSDDPHGLQMMYEGNEYWFNFDDMARIQPSEWVIGWTEKPNATPIEGRVYTEPN